MSETAPKDAPKVVKSDCSGCGRETRHHVLADAKRGDQDAGGFSWGEKSQFLECCGCETTSVRKVYWDDSYSSGDEPDVKLYPPKLSRPVPDWFWQVDTRFQSLLKEVYAALGSGAAALPVMGARAILDMVIQDQVGDQGAFKLGLDALAEKGLLSSHDRILLEAAIEAGNAAAHRGFAPKQDDVHRVVAIAEHLLNSLYVLKGAAKGLKKVTPKRRRKSTKKTQSPLQVKGRTP